MQKLLAAGIVIILGGILILGISAAGQGQASVGGAIFIGPFPIAFGTGPNGTSLALVSVVIGAVVVGLSLLWARGARMSRTR
jgi:uncharacterized membrane protein